MDDRQATEGSASGADMDLMLRVERTKARNRRAPRWERELWSAYVDPAKMGRGPSSGSTPMAAPI